MTAANSVRFSYLPRAEQMSPIIGRSIMLHGHKTSVSLAPERRAFHCQRNLRSYDPKGLVAGISLGAAFESGGVLCPVDANSKICWRFCTTALRQKLTLLRCNVGKSSMAFCQWALSSMRWVMEVNFSRWWSVSGGPRG